MIFETISSILILGIAILFLNPGHLTMPESMISMLIIGLILSFLAFAAYLLREKASDEREAVHILVAGRISYMVGVGTLIFGVILQTLKHEIDPWIVIALCAMILSKLLSRIYSRFKL